MIYKKTMTASTIVKAVITPDNNIHNIKALSLVKSIKTTDETPYQLRQAPSSIGNNALEKVVGLTVCFNQLVEDSDININGTGVSDYVYPSKRWSMVSGHKYLIMINGTIPSGSRFRIRDSVAGIVGSDKNGSFMYEATASTTNSTCVQYYVANGLSFDLFQNVFDLTAMFGSTVADYLYNLEKG